MSNPPRSTANVVLTVLGVVCSACLGLAVLGYVALWLLLSHLGPIG
ncbi:MAG TPA: hypothetical protein VF053_05470 [Streptosporangiales bacterium]